MKKIFFLSCIFLLSCMSNAFAHTHLESSIPHDGEVIQEELKQITLTFGTKIEQGSEFTLQTTDGTSIPVENITVADNQLVGDIANPLENGDYQVNWSIIGADGHVMEGDFSFTVDAPVAEPTEEQNTIEEPATEEVEPQTTVEENEAAPTVNEDNQAETEDDTSTSSNIVPIIIGLLVVIVIGSILFLMKRKK